MQALKGLVAGLTVLIIIAMTVIAYGLYRKSDEPDFKFFSFGADNPPQAIQQPSVPPVPATTSGRAPGGALKSFGEVMLSLPEGCSIGAVSGDGARIFLKIGPAGPKCERVLVVNAANGALLGTLKVTP